MLNKKAMIWNTVFDIHFCFVFVKSNSRRYHARTSERSRKMFLKRCITCFTPDIIESSTNVLTARFFTCFRQLCSVIIVSAFLWLLKKLTASKRDSRSDLFFSGRSIHVLWIKSLMVYIWVLCIPYLYCEQRQIRTIDV